MADSSSNLVVAISLEDDITDALYALIDALGLLMDSVTALTETMSTVGVAASSMAQDIDAVAPAATTAATGLSEMDEALVATIGNLIEINAELADTSAAEVDAAAETSALGDAVEAFGDKAGNMIERLLIRSTIILALVELFVELKQAVTDAEAANAGYTSQMDAADDTLQKFLVTVGDEILPTVVMFVDAMAQLAQKAMDNKAAMTDFGQALFVAGQGITTLIIGIVTLVEDGVDLVKILEDIGNAISGPIENFGQLSKIMDDVSKGDFSDAWKQATTDWSTDAGTSFADIGSQFSDMQSNTTSGLQEIQQVWQQTFNPPTGTDLPQKEAAGVKTLSDAYDSATDDINKDLQSVADKLASTNASMESLNAQHAQTQQTAQQAIAQAYVDEQKKAADLASQISNENLTAMGDATKTATSVQNAYTYQANADKLANDKETYQALEADLSAHATVASAYAKQISEIEQTSTQTALDKAISDNDAKMEADDQVYQNKSKDLDAELAKETDTQTKLVAIHNELKDAYAQINDAEVSNNKNALDRMLAQVKQYAAAAAAAMAGITGSTLTTGASPIVAPLSANVGGSSVATASGGYSGGGAQGPTQMNITVQGNISSHEDALSVGQQIASAIAPHLAYQGGTATA